MARRGVSDLPVDILEDFDTGLGELLDNVASLGGLAPDGLLLADDEHVEWRLG